MPAMTEAGVSSFKLFMAYKGELMTRDDALAATMDRARDLGGLIMVHAENGDLVDLLVKRALARGDTSAINHALTRPEIVEAEATSRAARLAEHTGASLFVVHVTCAAAAAEVEAAQQRGVAVSGETCTQYLVNTIDDLRRPGVEGCRYICSPPLRDAANHEPLWDYVRRGVLESVSTDHCPFRDEQKARGLHDFSLVPNGLPTIQHRLAKLWDEGVVAGRLTPSQLVDRTSTTIARRFGLHAKGAIAPGKDADIVVFDPAAPRPYGVATSLMNVDYDLYEGEVASGSVRHTYSRGTLVYDRGEIRTAPGHGRFVTRSSVGAAVTA
jgi:dihydropyrimidinase